MVIIYSLKDCSYCIDLKEKLGNIEYDERDITIPEYEKEFNGFYEMTKSDKLPLMVIGKQVFAPELSFKNIEEAVALVKKFT